VYDAALGYNPNLVAAADGTLWLAWQLQIVPTSWIYVKSSVDGGATWGTGPTDIGTQVSNAAMFVWPRLLLEADNLHLFLAYGTSHLAQRTRALSGGAWSAETTIYSSSGVGSDFDVALTDTGGLAVVVSDPLPRYREFDGFTWGPVVTVDPRPSLAPQLFFRDASPIIMFLTGIGPSQFAILHTARVGGAFLESSFVDRRSRPYDRVLLYHAGSGSYHDVTSAAADSMTGDLIHPQSGATLAGIGDRVYVGLEDPFRFLTILLSTSGSGGTVSYSYWDGSGWKQFTPLSGASNLSALTNQMSLWSDYDNIPKDWQKSTVNTHRLFWLRIESTSAFGTAPVGYQITAVSELQRIIARR
jgi:hypothetical protein